MSHIGPPGRFVRGGGVGLGLALALGVAGCGLDEPSHSSLVAASARGGGHGGGEIPPRFQPLVDALLSEQQQLAVPGVAVAIVEHGQVTFARGFGTKHPGEDEPVLPTTLFRIASNTKKHTAVGLLQLVGQGLVDLGEPVTSYAPGFRFALDASWAPAITVEHLLTHTAAMPDWLDVASSETDDAALAEHFEGGWFTEHGYVMAPAGAMYDYSNPSFMVAGLVIESVTGEPYRQYMSGHVYGPLGMARTLFLPSEVLADGDFAWGLTNDAWTPAPTGASMVVGPDSYDNGWGRPCAYAFSSVLDEAKLLRFLRDGDPALLDDELRQTMQSPHVSTETMLDLESYGYGLFVDRGVFLDSGARFYDVVRVMHPGALPGYSSDFELFPGLDFGFITLANGDGAYFHHSLEVALATLTELPAPTAPPDLSTLPASYGAYVGEYFDPFLVGRIVVSQQGEELHLALPVLDYVGMPYDPVLHPVAPNNFYQNIDGFVSLVTFILDGQGQGRYYRTHDLVGRRVVVQSREAEPWPRLGPAELLRRLRAAPPEPREALRLSTPRQSR
jgi:CubicO group peptidase (beta-lactamase class C family)